jgi:two-component system OmpR family sensor kinase
MKWRWLLALLPLAPGVVLVILARAGRFENPNLYLSGPISAVTLSAGLLVTGLAAALIYWRARAKQSHQAEMTRLEAQHTEEHRRFLRRLDHELKNPLMAIRAGLANLSPAENSPGAPLPETGSGAVESQVALDTVRAQVLRLGRLSADLRKLADLEARPLERSPVDVTELLQEVVEVVQDRLEVDQGNLAAPKRELTLTVPRAPWPLPEVKGDPDLLFLAVHNLLTNAMKFTSPGDRIEVRAQEDGAAVAIEVADTGPGIPEDELSLVWEELYRGKGARGIPGSGLGLALVRAIAERHGGAVDLRSREGQGTVFTLHLPTG